MQLTEAKWSALVSYGLSTRALQDFLPVDESLSPSTVRNHTIKAAQRCEDALKEEDLKITQGRDEGAASGETEQCDPITVGIDGGYLRRWHERGRSFEVIVGKSVPADGEPKCFGAVQQNDVNPQLRLLRVLLSQDMRWGQQVRFLSDGEPAVREVQLHMGPYSDHVLDWFHITKRFTVLKQYIKGAVRIEKEAGEYSHSSAGYV